MINDMTNLIPKNLQSPNTLDTNQYNALIGLDSLALGSLNYFSFKGRRCWARIIKVYDGDTITGVIDTGIGLSKVSIRLIGIDACEMRSKDPVLRSKAILCRDRVKQLIGSSDPTDPNGPNMVWIVCKENDKYGRLLADIYRTPFDTERIQDVLIREGHCYAYDGGTKKTESEQIDYYNSF